MSEHPLMKYDLQVPRGYLWLIEQGLAGFKPFTALQPWYYLGQDEVFVVNEKWPNGPCSERLVAFARRQDCDDIACFKVNGKIANGILVIHGWTEKGYQIVSKYDNLWNWLKSVIDDMAEWSMTEEEEKE